MTEHRFAGTAYGSERNIFIGIIYTMDTTFEYNAWPMKCMKIHFHEITILILEFSFQME